MHGKSGPYAAVVAAVILAASATSFAQQPPPDQPVTREEYNNLLKQLDALRQEVTELKQEKAAAATQPAAGDTAEVKQLKDEVAELKKQRTEDQADAEERAAEIEKIAKDAIAAAREQTLGGTKLLITGDADVGFTAQKGSTNTFSAGVAPRFLWKLNDQMEFDAAMDIGIERDDSGNNNTAVDLTIARFNYIINDYLTVGAGLFVAPFAAYHRDFDPSWINKLPDDPLVFSDNGLGPSSVLGAYASGAYPINSMKVNYAFYFSNGPELSTTDPGSAGSLGWDNFTDLNNNKAFGGRVGFLPIPQLEIGYSFLYGQASPGGSNNTNNFPNTNALLQAVDFNYTSEIPAINGTLSLRTEWVWSQVDNATYDPKGTAGFGPLNFNNNRNGGYVQIAYRPTLANIKLLRNVEGVFRYDNLAGPASAPSGGGYEQRFTVGFNYWLDSRSVLKFAYECDEVSHGSGSPAYLFQYGVGF